LPLKYPADGFLFATNARIIFFLFFPFFIWFSGFNCLFLSEIIKITQNLFVSIAVCFQKGVLFLKVAFVCGQVLFFFEK